MGDFDYILQVQYTHKEAVPLKKGYDGDAGMDMSCIIENETGKLWLEPNEFLDLPTGIHIALPCGFWAEIRGRSSAAWKRHIMVHPGVIDEGYRGELRILVQNMNPFPVEIFHHDRLAQLICHLRTSPAMMVVEELPISRDGRGENGFGSTGYGPGSQE